MVRDFILIFITIFVISFFLPVLDAFSVYIQNIINARSHEIQIEQELHTEVAKQQIADMSSSDIVNNNQVGFRVPDELELDEGEENYGEQNKKS